MALLLVPAVLLSVSLRAATPANVDAYLLKAFAAAYPSAEKISWSEENGHFVVHFMDHAVRSVIEYDADAKMVHSIRYYSDAAMLPQTISWEYHRRFPDKSLYGIIEVSDGDATAWFLKGQNAKQWTTVKVWSDGAMEVVEKIKKQL